MWSGAILIILYIRMSKLILEKVICQKNIGGRLHLKRRRLILQKLLQKQIELNYKGSLVSVPPAFFVYTPGLLLEARKSISNKNSNFDTLQFIIENSPLVMFDDIGCIPLKDYDLLILSTLIEGRLLRGLSSIFTTNLQGEALKEVLGDRLYDRISRLSQVITFKADSLRGSDDK